MHPSRTPSGYRKYSAEDLEQLRAVLRLQREQYLPLRVIRELSDAGRLTEPQATRRGSEQTAPGEDRAPGDEHERLPAEPEGQTDPSGQGLPPPELTTADDGPLSLRELCRRSGAGIPLVRELLSFGLIQEGPGRYNTHDVVVAAAALELHAFGVQPRHLRTLRQAADREIGLVEQAVATEATRRTPEAARRSAQRAQEITRLCLSVHAALVSSQLQDLQRAMGPLDD